MIVEVKVPEVGESITEGVIVEWFKKSGDAVKKDDPLFELETDKITMQVQSEAEGVLSVSVEQGDVEVGQVVGSIDTESGASAAAERRVDPAESAKEPTGDQPAVAAAPADAPLSPAARVLAEEHGIDPREISGSGKGGRVTKGDVLAAIEGRQGAEGDARDEAPSSSSVAEPAPPSTSPSPSSSDAPAPAAIATREAERGEEQALAVRETREKMSSLRRRVASRLVEVQQSAAILSTFNEADMSGVIALRKRFQERFVERHGIKLGMMSFFVKAVVEALKTVPALNARIEGEEIVTNHYYDIGVAVGTERGLVVPVIRAADELSYAEIEATISDFARRARERRLELSELQGGCFTVSNGGVYGSMLSTPILNPPQSGILGMHAIKKRPVVVGDDDRVEVRPMMYLALSYDHRLVDGLEAVTFLKRIVECIEDPQRLLFEV